MATDDSGVEPGSAADLLLEWRRPDPLFDRPLPLPAVTAYDDLEIEPDATDLEVKWARQDRIDRLESEKAELEQRLAEVRRQVTGLEEASAAVQELRNREGEAPERELRQVQRRFQELEGAARRIDPEFHSHRKRIAEIGGRIESLNVLALDSHKKRLAYDRAHPPLALLRLSGPAEVGFLDDVRTAFFLLREELSAFLARPAGKVFHPSDLTREDFSSDFTPYEELDGEREP